jgi:hypothetical protein
MAIPAMSLRLCLQKPVVSRRDGQFTRNADSAFPPMRTQKGISDTNFIYRSRYAADVMYKRAAFAS